MVDSPAWLKAVSSRMRCDTASPLSSLPNSLFVSPTQDEKLVLRQTHKQAVPVAGQVDASDDADCEQHLSSVDSSSNRTSGDDETFDEDENEGVQ